MTPIAVPILTAAAPYAADAIRRLLALRAASGDGAVSGLPRLLLVLAALAVVAGALRVAHRAVVRRRWRRQLGPVGPDGRVTVYRVEHRALRCGPYVHAVHFADHGREDWESRRRVRDAIPLFDDAPPAGNIAAEYRALAIPMPRRPDPWGFAALDLSGQAAWRFGAASLDGLLAWFAHPGGRAALIAEGFVIGEYRVPPGACRATAGQVAFEAARAERVGERPLPAPTREELADAPAVAVGVDAPDPDGRRSQATRTATPLRRGRRAFGPAEPPEETAPPARRGRTPRRPRPPPRSRTPEAPCPTPHETPPLPR